jgi:hypothetical protein
MTLGDKVKDALDEVRMLILGTQILFGFQFNAVFREGFDKLPRSSQLLDGVALVLMLTVVVLLLFPPAWHRIVEEGKDSERLLRLVTRIGCGALLPFAAALGIDLYVLLREVVGPVAAAAIGVIGVAAALFFWFVLEFWRRRKLHPEKGGNATIGDRVEDPGLHQKIVQMLTEARVILPGAQALLGFQLLVILTDSFEKLPEASKLIHAASLCALALAIVLLMAPAAYHRIVHEGEASSEFHAIGSLMIMAATVPLALGLAGDLYVVLQKIVGSVEVAALLAVLALAGLVALWYVYPALKRRERTGEFSLLPRRPGYAR